MLKKVWSKIVYPDKVLSVNYSIYDSFGLVEDYVKDRTLEALLGCTVQNIYDDYLEYCTGRFNPLSKIMFFKDLRENHNCKNIIRKIDGKSYRIMVLKAYSPRPDNKKQSV